MGQSPSLHASVQNAFSWYLHPKLICLFENIHDKVLHSSLMLSFHWVSSKTRYNSSKIFWGEFFLASLLRAHCSILPFSGPDNFASSALLKMQLQLFFSKVSWTWMTPIKVLRNLMMIKVKEKYAALKGPLRRGGCTWLPTGDTWGRRKKQVKWFLKSMFYTCTHIEAWSD